MSGEIVLGYEGSDGGKAALSAAISLAETMGVKILVVFGYAVWQVGGEVGDYQRAVERIGRQRTAEALAAIEEAGVEGEVVLSRNRPAESLIEVAIERNARMIVVGTHGEGPLVGAVLGSVPYRLLPRSPVPVLVVPPPA